MALEVFKRVDAQGDDDGGVYIFTGMPADLRLLSSALRQAYEAKPRRRKLKALADRITEASKSDTPLVKLEKPEGRMLMDAVSRVGDGKPASNKYAELYERLGNCLQVYGG